METILKYFQKLTLAHKIIGGFSVFGLLFILVIGIAFITSNNNRNVIDEIIHKNRPAVMLSAKLRENVEAASAFMGFYLLSKDIEHKKDYENSLVNLKKNIATLKKLPAIAEDQVSLKMVSSIQAKLDEFAGFKDKVLLLVEKESENFPALLYGSQNINPLSQKLLQIVTMMILSEEEEAANGTRKKLLKDLGDLRYATSAMMGGIRAYLALRNPAAVNEVKLYGDQVETVIGRLRNYSEILTFEQEAGVEEFTEVFGQFQNNFQEAFNIHSSDKWRMDSYLLRTKISPLVDETLTEIEKLVSRQTGRAKQSSEGLFAEVDLANQILIVATLLAAITVSAIVFIIYRFSIKPIRETVKALENISAGEGDLTRRLEVKGEDEVGQLAMAFNQFVSRIQDLISQSANVAENMSEGVSQL
ncbi:MAG: cell wall metabolism sensor histidine kinase WalK, partial [Gammaproteobacteria bacterium]|nr:cell wall metabolism sensor histidine kinase WalK [Gammaproteobacteria bacterium]